MHKIMQAPSAFIQNSCMKIWTELIIIDIGHNYICITEIKQYRISKT